MNIFNKTKKLLVETMTRIAPTIEPWSTSKIISNKLLWTLFILTHCRRPCN